MVQSETIATAMRRLQSGAWRDAEIAATQALENAPGDLNALLLQGLAIAAMGESRRAAPILREIAHRNPGAADPCIDLSQLQPPLPRRLVARQLQACLDIDPEDARLRQAYAEFLLDNDWPDQAETVLAQARDEAGSHHLRGLAQAEQGRFKDAAHSFGKAVTYAPDSAASWSNLGMVQKIQGHFPQAIAAHDKAVALDPENPRFRVNRAVTLLASGAWDRAWGDYEARLDVAEGLVIDRLRLLPSLRKGDSLRGVTVLAMHEDGFGDTLHFCRYLPMLAEHGARVIACVPPPLARLITGLPGVARVVTDSRALPAHDFICPMFSLPRVFGTTPKTVPPVVQPLIDQHDIAKWSHRLPSDGLKTGLVWAGQARPSVPGFKALDRRRSAGLAALAPLGKIRGLRLVSLQAGPPARAERPAGMDLFDPMPEVRDFADTAAIIANLDVVVSVDTSVVHLAGLMGKPVFMLDRYDGCWRWLARRRDSPWYPQLTIFRQPAPGDWSSAVNQLAASLGVLTLFRGSRHQESQPAAHVA
jgi:tetratricopeptide (TPR) repeat protein